MCGERFLFKFECRGGGGVFAQGCFAVRNRLQPSASIRNRSHLRPYGLTIGDCWSRCHFWMLETTCNAFLYVRCGTSWHRETNLWIVGTPCGETPWQVSHETKHAFVQTKSLHSQRFASAVIENQKNVQGFVS